MSTYSPEVEAEIRAQFPELFGDIAPTSNEPNEVIDIEAVEIYGPEDNISSTERATVDIIDMDEETSTTEDAIDENAPIYDSSIEIEEHPRSFYGSLITVLTRVFRRSIDILGVDMFPREAEIQATEDELIIRFIGLFEALLNAETIREHIIPQERWNTFISNSLGDTYNGAYLSHWIDGIIENIRAIEAGAHINYNTVAEFLNDLDNGESVINVNKGIVLRTLRLSTITTEERTYYDTLRVRLERRSEAEVTEPTPIADRLEDLLEESDNTPANYSRFKGADWFEVVQQQDIILAGVGGIGSWVNIFLSRVGPRSLIVFDDDRFEAHNMSGQAVRQSDIGNYKTTTATVIAREFSNYEIQSFAEKYTEENSITRPIMVCGFDNMEARKVFYNAWKRDIPKENANEWLFIDGRLTATMFQIFSIQGDDEWAMRQYEENYLFDDDTADDEDCTLKQTSHVAGMIASYMTLHVVNFCSNMAELDMPKRIPWFKEFNSLTNIYTHEFS